MNKTKNCQKFIYASTLFFGRVGDRDTAMPTRPGLLRRP